MPRIAGDKPEYQFRMCRIDGEKVSPTGYGFGLRSVTTILDNVIAKPFSAGIWTGYNQGVVAMVGRNWSDISVEEAKKELTSLGLDPNSSVSKDAGRGSDAHSILEYLAQGNTEMAERLAANETQVAGTKYGQAVLDFWRDYGMEQVAGANSELPVWSLRHAYAGTLDLLAGGIVYDLKTHKPAAGFTKDGKGPAYLSDLTQTRAYRTALSEMGVSTSAGRILIARANGKYLVDEREVPEEFWFKVLELDRMKVELEGGK